MFLNLSQLREELQQRVKNVTISQTRLDRWLNMGQDDIANALDPDNLITNIAFQTASTVRKYYLEYEFNKITSIMNEDTDLELDQSSEAELETADPSRNQTGDPYLFAVYGLEWVKAQPAVASAITVVSTDATDMGTIRINGTVSGVPDTEILSLNGVASVTGLKLFSEISSLAKSDVSVGKITVTAAATTLSELGPTQLARQYQPLFLWPTPTSIQDMRARGYRRPRSMVNAEDYPDMPESYHEAVLIAAELRGHRELFRPKIAEDIQAMVFNPMLDKLKKQQGNKRRKRSIILQGDRQGYRPIGRYGSQFEVG